MRACFSIRAGPPVSPTPVTSPSIVLDDEHHHHRSRRERYALRTIKADVVCRMVLIAVRLVSIPFALRLLGVERYGLWLTAGSVLTWLNLSQMGLGDGLLNELAKAFGRNDRASMQRHVSTAYCCFALISLLAAACIAALSHSSFVVTLLGVQHAPHLLHDAQTVFLLTGLLLAATLFVNASSAVWAGLQETYLYYVFFSIGNLAILGVLAILSFTGANLPVFTLAMGVPPLLITAGLTVYLFGWRHPYLRPRLSLFDRNSLRLLMNFGGPLMVVQIADLAIYNSSSPLIAARLGLAEVPRYAVALSIFMLVSNFCNAIARAYLGGYVEACARNDWPWIKSATWRIRRNTMALMGAAVVPIVWLGPWALRVWAGKTVVPSTELLACMAVYCFLMVVTNTNTVVLLGLGHPGLKAALEVFIALAHIAGFFLLMPRLHLLALPIAGSIGFMGDVIVSSVFISRSVHQHLKAFPAAPGVAQA
jgi:O-antigen/teichoic acid export membrane protein